jgi:hypothetical protein
MGRRLEDSAVEMEPESEDGRSGSQVKFEGEVTS